MSFEDWQVLYREILQLDREISGQPPLIDGKRGGGAAPGGRVRGARPPTRGAHGQRPLPPGAAAGASLAYLGHSGAPEEAQLSVDGAARAGGGQAHRAALGAGWGARCMPRLTSAHTYGAQQPGGVPLPLRAAGAGVASRLLGGAGARWSRCTSCPGCGWAGWCWRARGGGWRSRSWRGWRRLRGPRCCERARAGCASGCGMPRRVALVDADNVLPLDLENVLCRWRRSRRLVKEPRRCARRAEQPDAEALCAPGPEGAFTHGADRPLRPEAGRAGRARRVPRRVRAASPPRTEPHPFPPGSAWLYAKLYTGTASADLLLREHLAPLIRRRMGLGRRRALVLPPLR